ncbi:MAG: hypothetical protein ACREJC_03705 [Tepidisphaeraceae bacterium]
MRLSFGVVLLCFATLSRAQPAGDALPTMQELRALLNEKQYQPLLQKVARVLSLKGQAGQSYDRYECLMLKGEAHLQLKTNSAAMAAFTEAAKDSKTSIEGATARAMIVLMKKSQAFAYNRKTPTTQPGDAKSIDILDRAKRKDAFAALAADELAAVKPKLKTAQNAKQLAPIVDALKALGNVRDAELAATGTSDQVDQLMPPLAQHAHELIASTLKDLADKAAKIDQNANTSMQYPDPNRGGPRGSPTGMIYGKQGLTSKDKSDLKDIIATCQKIQSACEELAAAFGDAGKVLGADGKEAQSVSKRADGTLNADYTGTSTTPGGR